MLLWNAIELSQVTLDLVLKIFDAIDVLAILHERFVVINPLMLKLRNV